ncbi:MAG: VgrG-related protein [Anaerolineae bacterium]|nr:VgrG-related protein [Anaerolineae bacterium]
MTTAYLHSFSVDINGPLDEGIEIRIFRLEVDTTLGMASTFALYFHDNNGTLADDSTFELGKAIKIKTKGMGETSEALIFEGEITSVEPHFIADGEGTQFVVRGYDKTHRLTKGTQRRVFKDATHSDIVKEILGDYLLSPDAESTTPKYDHVFQDNISDRDFIEGLARINGFTFGFADGKVYFKKPAGDTTVTMTWKEELLEFHPRINAVGMVDKVIVTGWNPVEKKEITGQATSSNSQPTSVTDSTKGIKVAKDFGASTYQAYIPDVKDPSAAEKIAQALLNTFNSAFVEAEGVVTGTTKLVAGTKLEVKEIGDRFNGTYFITSARHVIEENQYRVYFSSEGAKAHMLSDMILGAAGAYRENGGGGWRGVVPAIVTNIKDDENDIVRVKVKYPWMDNELESHWARLAGVGAGQSASGIHWLPQVNDEVLVAFENGNINRPYVLGGLWNGTDKPPQVIGDTLKSDKVNIRTIQTPAGNKIVMYDASGEEKIEIIDAKGVTSITLDGGGKMVDIKTSGDLTIKADGSVTIEGNGITIKSDSTLDLEGSGASKLKTSAALTIEGSTVAIN